MRAPISVMALLWVPFFTSAQSIYDSATRLNPKVTTEFFRTCYVTANYNTHVSTPNECKSYLLSLRGSVWGNVEGFSEGSWYNVSGTTWRLEYTYCTKCHLSIPTINNAYIDVTVSESFGQDVESCPPDDPTPGQGALDYSDFYLQWEDEQSQTKCLSPRELVTLDTCSDSTHSEDYLLPANGNTEAHVCVNKTDGSSCGYDLHPSGEFYVGNFETNCYNIGGEPQYDETGMQTPDANDPNACQDIGNGTSFCPEDPINMCDSNGNCTPSCGYVGFGDNEPVFGCLSQDTDNDGLADVVDPDIDGDGIRNEDDIDADGDGQDDPLAPGQDAQANVVNVDIDEQAIADSIVSGLTESTDLDSLETSSTASIDAKSSELTNAVDAALADENFNLANTLTESGFDTSLDAVKTALTPSSCTNTINIPGTDGYVDVCGAAETLKPYLYWFLAIITTLYVFYRVTGTLRGTD